MGTPVSEAYLGGDPTFSLSIDTGSYLWSDYNGGFSSPPGGASVSPSLSSTTAQFPNINAAGTEGFWQFRVTVHASYTDNLNNTYDYDGDAYVVMKFVDACIVVWDSTIEDWASSTEGIKGVKHSFIFITP